MKVIMVTETEMRSLVERLELKLMQAKAGNSNTLWKTTPEAMAEAHRSFHYEVVRWVQEMGSSYPNR
jgi:hypothetical protein